MTGDSSLNRYSRQERFAELGAAGQARLASASVLICGCGALGSVIAERLARAGVGHLRLVDRDWVEWTNLQRQTLFEEADATAMRPKAVAAADALQRINSEIRIEPIVDDLTYLNLREMATGCDLILDGTDNFETRFLLNDYCVQTSTPWVHGGCLGASGQVMTIIPGKTACFRCLLPEMPPRDFMQTCDSAGVLGPAVSLIAAWQAAEALKILSGHADAVCDGLLLLDSWHTSCRIVKLSRSEQCVCCGQLLFPYLSGEIRSEATVLCGKDAVQIDGPHLARSTLDSIAERLAHAGELHKNAFFVRLKLPKHTLTVFRGGRTVVEGTTDLAEAKSIVARTLGA